MRYCARCKRIIPPGHAVIISAQEAGSGAPIAQYAHQSCAPTPQPERPRYVQSPPPSGFHR